MDPDDYFRFVLPIMRRFSRFSPERDAWVIPFVDAEVIFLEHLDKRPMALSSFAAIFAEGRQRGLWNVVSDSATGLTVVVLQHRLPVISA